MRRNLRQNMRKDKAKNVKQIVFSMQSQDEEEVEVEAGEEEEEVEWELVEVSQGKTLPNWFRDINGTCRRSLAVDYFTGSPFLYLSLSLSPLSHYSFLLACHTVHAALIWFLARLALCFAFGVSFAVISPSAPSPLYATARKSLWLIVVIDGRLCLPSSLPPSLYCSASISLTVAHKMLSLCLILSSLTGPATYVDISHGIFHIRNPQKCWINGIGVLWNFSETESPFTIASIISYMKCFALKTNHKICRHPFPIDQNWTLV